MASQPSSRRNFDDMKAARKYVRKFPDHAAQFVFDHCDPVEQLRLACANKGHSDEHFHRMMFQNSDSEDDHETKSQSSWRRTMSGGSSTLTSYSSDSGNGPPRQLWVKAGNGSKAPKTLTLRIIPVSDCLISIDTVRDHLGMQFEPLPDEQPVRYNGGQISSFGSVSIDWARKPDHLDKRHAHKKTIFHVVENLPGTQVVFGEMEPEWSHMNHASSLPIAIGAGMHSTQAMPIAENSTGSLLRGHGARLQQRPYTNSYTDNSTTRTVKPTVIEDGSSSKETRQSVTSNKSQIPIANASGVRHSIATANQHHTRDSRVPQSTPTPPPPVSQIGVTSGLTVDVSYGKSEWSIELQLDAAGAEFFELLSTEIWKKTKRNLKRQTDMVRFALEKDDLEECRWVSLQEHRIKKDWRRASKWLGRFNEECDVIAVVGPEPGAHDTVDEPPD